MMIEGWGINKLTITLKLVSGCGPLIYSFRSSHLEVFWKKGVLRNVAKFTGKHLCQSLLLQPQACNLIKKQTLAQVFSCEFCEISKDNLSCRTPPVAASVVCCQLFIIRENVRKIFFIFRFRGIFRTKQSIYDGVFSKNSYRLKTGNYFCKNVYLKCSTGFMNFF